MRIRLTVIAIAGVLAFVVTGCVQSGLVHDVQPGAGQQPKQIPDSTTETSTISNSSYSGSIAGDTAEASTQTVIQGSNTIIVLSTGTQVSPQNSNLTISTPIPAQSSPMAGSPPAKLPGSKGSAEPYNPLPFPGSGGIEGKVLIGPTCPVQIAGSTQCEDKPFKATISILNQNGQVLCQVESDAQGKFVVYLAPGTYILQPVTKAIYPRGTTLTVTVLPGQLAQVTISFDSGIR